MKILLLGDFSAHHKNLKDGLLELGHEVTLVSNGDGWKEIDSDINLSMKGKSFFHKLYYRFQLMKVVLIFKDYDVVQLVSPFFFPVNIFPYKYIFNKLKKNNKKIFLCAAGSDSFYWRLGRENLRYGPYEDYLKYDCKSESHLYETDSWYDINKFVASSVDGIIPIMFEYQNCYSSCDKLCSTIPIPMNTDLIKFQPNIVKNKIVVFHGLSRYGFKGTRFVEKAFEILREKYSDRAEFIIDGKMPLDEYLNLMKRTNIVIDQTYSYSLGLNGIYALAMGKVVLGGAEPESLKALNVEKSPVINVLPNVDDIVSKIECLLDNKNSLNEIGQRGRDFVENIHCHKKIAGKYIKAWQG